MAAVGPPLRPLSPRGPVPPTDPVRAGARFYKAHGLGNDYLVVEGGVAWTLTPVHATDPDGTSDPGY